MGNTAHVETLAIGVCEGFRVRGKQLTAAPPATIWYRPAIFPVSQPMHRFDADDERDHEERRATPFVAATTASPLA